MTRDGCEGASMAKKKSGPRPTQAVPSFRSLALKVAVIASRRPARLDLASSINCGAVIFSAAIAGAMTQSDRRANLHIEAILYRGTRTSLLLLALALGMERGPGFWAQSPSVCNGLRIFRRGVHAISFMRVNGSSFLCSTA